MNIQATSAPKPRTPAESVLIDSFAERMGDLPGNGDVVIARDTALEALKVQGLPRAASKAGITPISARCCRASRHSTHLPEHRLCRR